MKQFLPTTYKKGAHGTMRAESINMKTVQAVLLATVAKNVKFLLNRAVLISRISDTISNGATVNIKEVDLTTKIAATLTTNLTGATNNDMVFTARKAGAFGNSITVRYVDPSANDATLSVSVLANAITVNLATNGSGTITSTAALVKAAIEASTEANDLVSVANAASNNGSGLVAAMSATALSGGQDWTDIKTVAGSTDLADSDDADDVQALTISSAEAFTTGNGLVLYVTGGSTATTDEKDLVVDYTVF